MPAIGKKAKAVNIFDNAMASQIQTLYSIELSLMTSKAKKVKCGAIVVFKLNDIQDLDWNDQADAVEVFEAQKELNEMTEVMFRDPEYFRQTEGRWIPWAIARTLQIFDDLGTNADISIKSPRLRIVQKIPRSEIISGRADPKKLFWTAWDIDKLLDKDYQYDPWLKQIRRGRIGPKMAKR